MVITTGWPYAVYIDFKSVYCFVLELNLKVGLFVTCLVDALRPSIGFAALELIESSGYEVHVPEAQTCCGQPAWNSGDNLNAQKLARKWLSEFEQYDYVVIPSGSCAGMVVTHYQEVFKNDPDLKGRAASLAEKTYELTDFLVKVVGIDTLQLSKTACASSITYHDSCSGLRELNIQAQPRQLIAAQHAAELVEMRDSRQCCGFGGTFSIKYGEISTAICDDKCQQIIDAGVQAVVLGDLGCMLNIEGRLRRLGHNTQVVHIAELLTGRKPAEIQPENREI